LRYETSKYSKDKKRDKLSKLKELKERKNRLFSDVESKKHLVSSGESLSEIAHQYSVSVAQLMAWNKLKSHTIRSGKNLIVKPLGHETKVTMMHGDGNIQGEEKINMHPNTTNTKVEKVAKTKEKKSKKESNNSTNNSSNNVVSTNKVHGETVHTVANGESLWIIANKYKTSINKIRQLNAMRNDKLSIGQKLVVK
jgi:LysM repeat protein